MTQGNVFDVSGRLRETILKRLKEGLGELLLDAGVVLPNPDEAIEEQTLNLETAEVWFGSNGAVVRCVNAASGVGEALKIMPSTPYSDVRERHRMEVRVARETRSDFVLPVLRDGEIAGLFYLVFPWCEKGSLRAWACEPIHYDQVLREASTALADLHHNGSGFTHGDISLDNFMIREGRLQLADFGSAGSVGLASASTTTVATMDYDVRRLGGAMRDLLHQSLAKWPGLTIDDYSIESRCAVEWALTADNQAGPSALALLKILTADWQDRYQALDVRFRELESALADGDIPTADRLTTKLAQSGLAEDSADTCSLLVIKRLDQLWASASRGQFGPAAQAAKLEAAQIDLSSSGWFVRAAECLGWLGGSVWVSPDDIYRLDGIPAGMLPTWRDGRSGHQSSWLTGWKELVRQAISIGPIAEIDLGF